MPDEKKTKLIPAPRAIAIALVAGALAGAVAVYVRAGLSGNAPPAVIAEAGEDGGICAARAERAKTVAAAATGDVAAMLAADPPRSLGALTFNGPDGKPMTLADRAGKTLLVNLWATWCAPCRAEMPALDALQKAAGSDSFEVMAINVDAGDDTKPKKFLAEAGIQSLAYYREDSLALFNDLKKRGLALGLPVTLLIDGDGCLLANMNGPAEWSGADALRLVEAALAK
jgi:thiol-disulfide isomerase/thioredoxin